MELTSTGDVMVAVAELKLKVLQYEREYLAKKGISAPTPEERLRMRRAVSSRLRGDMQQIAVTHDKITRRIFEKNDSDVMLHVGRPTGF